MKRILSVLLALVMVIGMIPMGILSASAAEVTETMTIAANAGTLASDSLSISWASGNLTFTANKNTSKDAIRTSDSDHFRLYVGNSATLTCSGGNITKIVATCTGSSYATALGNSVGAEATVSDSIVTITPSASSDTYTISSITKQARIKSIEVTYVTSGDECAHANTVEVAAVAATCTNMGYTAGVQCTDCNVFTSGHEAVAALGHDWSDWAQTTAPGCVTEGVETSTCANCGESKTQAIEATGHTYVDGVCSGCGKEQGAAVATQITTAEQFVSGKYVLVVSSGAAMGALDGSWVTAVQPEILDGAVLDAANGIWTLTVNGSSVTIVDANGVSIAPEGGNENGIISGEYSWAWSVNEDGTFVFAGVDTDTVQLASNTGSENKFRAYKNATVAGNTTSYLANFAVYKMNEGGEVEPDPEEPTCEHTNTTTTTVDATCTENGSTTVTCNDCGETVSTEVIEATGRHDYVDGKCSVCGEADPNADTNENVNIVFELGANGSATHNDGKTATEYTETVNGYTLTITDGAKMYTGAVDAKGNSCIKLGTSSVVGGFSFTAPDDVTEVVISIAKYKANNTTVNVNGTNYTLTNNSNDGAYDEITVDTSSNKTVTVTTVASTCRAMVNSITFICGSDSETGHTCEWDEGTVTTAATCTTDGVKTYSCTVDGCEKTKTETIKATGHSYTYTETAITCANCDYSATYTLTSLADARAAAIEAGKSNSASTYYIKGIVTYISDKNVYIEDSTAGFLVYFTSTDDAASLALGDEILVWDTVKTYNELTETSGTTSSEFAKGSSGNALPSQTVTLADLGTDTTNEYLGERVVIENVTIGVLGTNNTALTDAAGNTINIYKAPALSEDINENDTVTVTAIVSTYNGYQLLINPGTAATDVVETSAGEEEVVTTVTIAEAKAGTAGEYYQVEGVVTFIDGRNVYIQDATGGIVVYLTADAATTQVGDTVKAYGARKVYNGLIELDAVDETNAEFYSILSNGNTVDAQAVTIADLTADTTNEYLAEKITLNNVYVSYSYDYSSSYANVTYVLKDGENTITIYRAPAASEADVLAGGTIINVEAIVSSYNGYQLRVVGIESITVVGACTHETTELVKYAAATCTEAGYTGDTECTACGNYTVRGEEIAATGHNYNANGVCANNCGIVNVAAIDGTFYTTFADAYAAATEGQTIKLLATIGEDAPIEIAMDKDLYVDLNGWYLYAAVTANGYMIYGMDSCTDSYEAEEWGCLNVTGATVAPITNNSYLAVDEGGNCWSFHAYSIQLTHVSLDPANDALGYKAQIFGDEMVLAKVTGFGFHMGVEGGTMTEYSKPDTPTNGQFTLRLQNIMAVGGGEMSINADAFVVFGTAEGTSTPHSTTMKETIETVNDAWDTASYTDAQKTAVKTLCETYETAMASWEIANILAWGEVTDTVLYLNPWQWTSDSARIAAYYWDNNGSYWTTMTDADGDGIYECTIPAGYTNVIFARMNPSIAENSWDAKWNQTDDLTIPADGSNCFTIDSWGGSSNGNSTGTWSTFDGE